LGINRSSLYYHRQEMATDVVTLMNEIQEIYLSWPFFGYCRITAMLRINNLPNFQTLYIGEKYIFVIVEILPDLAS